MSAAEKLGALDEALDAYGWQIGWDSGEVYFSGGDPPIAALRDALPRIVAVVEAAETYCAFLGQSEYAPGATRIALAALDEALS